MQVKCSHRPSTMRGTLSWVAETITSIASLLTRHITLSLRHIDHHAHITCGVVSGNLAPTLTLPGTDECSVQGADASYSTIYCVALPRIMTEHTSNDMLTCSICLRQSDCVAQ